MWSLGRDPGVDVLFDHRWSAPRRRALVGTVVIPRPDDGICLPGEDAESAPDDAFGETSLISFWSVDSDICVPFTVAAGGVTLQALVAGHDNSERDERKYSLHRRAC